MPTFNRHNEIIILDSKPGNVAAHYYNVAQTALKRSGEPFRFRIPTLIHLDLIVQNDAWIVVDRVLNDMPVAAWTNFETEGRDNLHEPVNCEVRIYHFAARVVLQTTLDAMEDTLRQSLGHNNHSEKVLTFKKDE